MDLKKQKKIFKEQIFNPTKKDIDNASYQFALFSANIKKFIPNIDNNEYEYLFKNLLYHQKLSGAEQYDIEYLNRVLINNFNRFELDNVQENRKLIFATFHLGSYRLFNSILYEKGYKIVVIIDEQVYLTQQNNLLNSVKSFLKGKSTSDVVILNVKDRKSIFKLKNLINKGYVLTVYLDGNTGVNNENLNFKKSYIPIKYFNNEIYVKNGIGKLASLLDLSIIPIISYRNEVENNIIEIHQTISLNNFLNKKEFSIKSIENCYEILEEKVKSNISQWECWLYIHKWFIRGHSTPFELSPNYKCMFNTNRYTTFTLNKSRFIFDLIDYKSYNISNDIYELIRDNMISKINSSDLSVLKQKNIII